MKFLHTADSTYPASVDTHLGLLSDCRGALQCRFLESASSSLLVLFGPQSVASQERLRFFYPVRQIHVDDPIKPRIAGEGLISTRPTKPTE